MYKFLATYYFSLSGYQLTISASMGWAGRPNGPDLLRKHGPFATVQDG